MCRRLIETTGVTGSEVEGEKSEVIGDAAVDTPNHYDSGEDEDQEIMFRIQNGDDYV